MAGTAAIDNDITKYRLPINVVPKHYDILIKTDIQALKFEGVTTIQLDIKEPTSTITFNSSNLSFDDVFVEYTASNIKTIPPADVSFDEKMERATVALPESVAQGSSVKLTIKHSRDLTDELMGYYYSTYKDQGNEKRYALTQFEATAARRAFPCWDEPMLKATFEISMISKNDTVNLSNMPVVFESSLSNSGVNTELFHDQDHAEWKYTRFQPTPPMSTYIVAFANGDFKYLESSYTSPLSGKTRPLRIYATKELIEQGQFGLDVKAKVLPLYEKAFDIEYALPKLDTLVVHDFDAGAMENWGLITGRTTAYLVDPKRADIRSKQDIADTQSHEVAHMWFGNITTMKWWDNLWLNEGFATLMGEVIILNKVFPEWKVYSSFYNNHTSSALSLDSMPSSHPVQVDVPNADDIGQIFDDLSYSKAASILRMLSVYTGEEKFLNGVSIYLKAHLYGNTTEEDLWLGIQKATALDIPTMMTNWILKTGHPVITVKKVEGGIHIRQDRYFKTGVAKEEDNQTTWHIPLNVLTVDSIGKPSVNRQALLTTRETTYKLDTNQLWKLNQGATGFYRVLYSPDHLATLGEEAARANSAFSAEDRLSLLSDAMALASSGHALTSSALNFIDRLREEPEYFVWRAIEGRLSELIFTWWEQPDYEDLRGFLRTLLVPVVRKVGYEYVEGEDTDIRELRNTVISGAAGTGAAEVVHKLKQWFEVYLTTGSDSHIPADLLTPTFTAATRFGGRREWEKCKQVYLNPPTPRIQISAAAGLCATRNEELIEDTFKFVKTEVQTQNLYAFFFRMGDNVKVGRKLFSFLKDNYDDLYKRLEGTYQFGDLVKGASALMSTKRDAEDLQIFFKDKDTSKISYALNQALDDIYAKSAWIERSKEDIQSWLEEWKKNNKIEESS